MLDVKDWLIHSSKIDPKTTNDSAKGHYNLIKILDVSAKIVSSVCLKIIINLSPQSLFQDELTTPATAYIHFQVTPLLWPAHLPSMTGW